MRRILSFVALALLLPACDSGSGSGSSALTNAGYEQPCDVAAGPSACMPTYNSQLLRRPVQLQCFQHAQGQMLCSYACTPYSQNECDPPALKCNGKGYCADPNEAPNTPH